MVTLQGAELSVTHAFDIDSGDKDMQLEQIMRLFGECRNRIRSKQKHLQKQPLGVIKAQNWVMVLSISGLILLSMCLLPRLYTGQPFPQILFYVEEIYVEISSTTKVISLLITELPAALMNYQLKATGNLRVHEQIRTKYLPRVVQVGRPELIDQLSGIKYAPQATCNLNPLYLKGLNSTVKFTPFFDIEVQAGDRGSHMSGVFATNSMMDWHAVERVRELQLGGSSTPTCHLLTNYMSPSVQRERGLGRSRSPFC